MEQTDNRENTCSTLVAMQIERRRAGERKTVQHRGALCSKCLEAPPRAGQRYCQPCHNAAERAYRKAKRAAHQAEHRLALEAIAHHARGAGA